MSTTNIEFHIVNNAHLGIPKLWLRVDDTYYSYENLPASQDGESGLAEFWLKIPDSGSDHMTLTITDANGGLFGTDAQQQIWILKKQTATPVTLTIDGPVAGGVWTDVPHVTAMDQKSQHAYTYTLHRRGALSEVTIPSGH